MKIRMHIDRAYKALSRTAASSRSQRGFVLMIVIGLLAVLLMLCLGFLAFSHSEVNAVA